MKVNSVILSLVILAASVFGVKISNKKKNRMEEAAEANNTKNSRRRAGTTRTR